MTRLTTIDIIVEWLRTRMGRVIGSYEIETAIPKYAMLFHQHPVTPGTVNRKFRILRSDNDLQARYGLIITEEPPNGKESKWRVRPYTTNSPSQVSATELSSSQQTNSEAA